MYLRIPYGFVCTELKVTFIKNLLDSKEVHLCIYSNK